MGIRRWGFVLGLFGAAVMLSAQSYYPHMMTDHTGVLTVAKGGTGLSALGTAGQVLKVNAGGTALEYGADATGEGGGLPSGVIVLSMITCPPGFTEVAALSGKFVLGTVAGNGDVGGTGGSDTVTSVLNHTHGVNVTDPGHVHTAPAFAHATGTADNKFEVTNSSTARSASVNSNTTGITAATVNPAGGVASIDNRPAFLKVIFCEAD